MDALDVSLFNTLSVLYNTCIYACSHETGNETDEHAPEGLHKVVALLMVGCIHVLCARESDGLHIYEEHPIKKETVVPVDEEPDAITQCKG